MTPTSRFVEASDDRGSRLSPTTPMGSAADCTVALKIPRSRPVADLNIRDEGPSARGSLHGQQ
jgi:hypothetical protein